MAVRLRRGALRVFGRMKILYTCTYSAGISGVWNRVYNLARELIKKGHKVYVFSSDLEAGTLKKVEQHENVDGIEVFRFKVKKFGSKNVFLYKSRELKTKLRELMPDIVDCQTYRHPEGNIISKECSRLGISCILTTHAPFVDAKVRGVWLSVLSDIYDLVLGRSALKNFQKIIAIAKWEYPYLEKLGVTSNKIAYLPNGIPSEFFSRKRILRKKVKKIVFFGRIAPVKNIETLIKAFKLLGNEDIILKIVGLAEVEYKKELEILIEKLQIKNILFEPAVFDLKKKLDVYGGAEIFVLPSKREGMPQALVEAMASSCIVIASDIVACKELIEDGKNGFLFRQGDEKDLAEKLSQVIKNYSKLRKIMRISKKKVIDFRWDKIARKLEKLYCCPQVRL